MLTFPASRRDLGVIQNAAGMELPFGTREVWLSLAGAPCCAIVAASAAWGSCKYMVLSWLPVLLLSLIFVGTGVLRYRRHTGERREHRIQMAFVVSFFVAIACLVAFAKTFRLPYNAVQGAGLILAGFMFIPAALSHPARRVGLALPVALLPIGFALPFCTQRQAQLIAGFAVMACFLVGAAIMAGQLRARKGQDGPIAD